MNRIGMSGFDSIVRFSQKNLADAPPLVQDDRSLAYQQNHPAGCTPDITGAGHLLPFLLVRPLHPCTSPGGAEDTNPASAGMTAHARNVSDEVLTLLQQNGGVIMICFLPDLVAQSSSAGQRPTVSDVADHILYAAERIGFAHVGIGSDFDGMLQGPQDIDDVSQYPNLVVALLRRGVTDDRIQGILGGNVLRVMQEVEQTARRMRLRDSAAVLCDEIPAMWTAEQESWLRRTGEERMKRNQE
jgi:hypothetical protein